MSRKNNENKTIEEEEEDNFVESENDDSQIEGEDDDGEDERVPIDLSQNEIYRGVCTLLEDEEGNNILEYISLLHTELIGINKSLEHLKGVRKEMTRLADCAELILKSQKVDIPERKQSDEKRTKTRTTVTQC